MKKEFIEDNVTFSRESTTNTMNQPFVKVEHDVSDALFEYLVKQNRECQHQANVLGTKRKRIVGDNDDISDNDDNKGTVSSYADESCSKSVNSVINEDTDIGDVHFNEEDDHLKLEDAIKPEILMRDSDVLKVNDPYYLRQTHQLIPAPTEDHNFYYCCGCNKYIQGHASYLLHIKYEHLMKKIKHYHLKPDVNDSDFYCKACERKYDSRITFRAHLRKTHQMNGKSLGHVFEGHLANKLMEADQVIEQQQADKVMQEQHSEQVIEEQHIDNSQYYCCGCNRHINGQSNYLAHIRSAHSKKKIKHFHLKPDLNEPNFYCNACEQKYESRALLRSHLKVTHNWSQVHSVIEERKSGDSYYCCGCNILITDYAVYLRHIQHDHKNKKIKHFHLKPDANDPHLYCIACERKFESKRAFRIHLKGSHRLDARFADLEKQPSDDHRYYCCGCNRHIKNYSTYLNHIKHRHLKTRIKHYHLKPDVNDPDLYCKPCERTYFHSKTFRRHLRFTHSIESYQTTFSSRKSHGVHTSQTHKSTTSDALPKPSSSATPVQANSGGVHPVMEEQTSDDHQYYCCGCNRRIKSYSTYMKHIKNRHTKSKIKHYHLKPDVNDPDFYCKPCERTYFSLKAFRRHLKYTHSISTIAQSAAEKKQNAASANNDKQLNQNVPVPDPYCEPCQKTFSSHELYRDHTSQTHTSTASDTLPKTSSSSTPVQADSGRVHFAESTLPNDQNCNNHCNTCEVSYTSFEDYRNHLVRAHQTSLPPLVTTKLDNKRLHLDEGEQSCQPCGKQFKTLAEYKWHLRELHKLITTRSRAKKICNSLPGPDNDANIYCQYCVKAFNSRRQYMHHLRLDHPLVLKLAKQSPNGVTQPAGICQSPSYSKKMIKKNSKQESHATPCQTQIEQTKRPNPDNPNFKCTVCKIIFSSKVMFIAHCNAKHSKNLVPLPFRRNPVVVVRVPTKKPRPLPDPLDPQFYCRVCKTKKKSLHSHRRHCKEVHSMRLQHLQQVNKNPEAKIDMSSPSLYCAKCERSMSSKLYFKQHLKKYHNLKYPEDK